MPQVAERFFTCLSVFRGRPLYRNFSSQESSSFPVREQFFRQLLEKLMQFHEKVYSALRGAWPHAGNLGCLFSRPLVSRGFYLIWRSLGSCKPPTVFQSSHKLFLTLFAHSPPLFLWRNEPRELPTLPFLLMPYLFYTDF